SALTIIPISDMIKGEGYEKAFLYFGLGQGIVVFIIGLLLTDTRRISAAFSAVNEKLQQTRRDFRPMEMVRSPVFWVMYLMFVLLSGLVFFAWGEIYSLFPSTCTDTFGARYATTNAGLLYTAKGTASLLVPLSSVLMTATGGWQAVFVVAAIMNAAAALLAWFVLRPMRRAHRGRVAAQMGARTEPMPGRAPA